MSLREEGGRPEGLTGTAARHNCLIEDAGSARTGVAAAGIHGGVQQACRRHRTRRQHHVQPPINSTSRCPWVEPFASTPMRLVPRQERLASSAALNEPFGPPSTVVPRSCNSKYHARSNPVCVKRLVAVGVCARSVSPVARGDRVVVALVSGSGVTSPKCRCSGISRPRWIQSRP